MRTKKKKGRPTGLNRSEKRKSSSQAGKINRPSEITDKQSREKKKKEWLNRYRRGGGREEDGNYSWRETRGLFLWIIIMTPSSIFSPESRRRRKTGSGRKYC